MQVVVGFTLIEVLVVIVIIAILATLLVPLLLKVRQSQAYKFVSAWVNPPASIPPAPATQAFTYHVTKQKQQAGSPIEPADGRNVKFELNPSIAGSGRLISVTQDGTPFDLSTTNPPALMFVGTTDILGDIVVVVSVEHQVTANMVASDPVSGAADPPIVFVAQ